MRPLTSSGFSILNVIISLALLFLILGSLGAIQNQTSQYNLSSQQERDSVLMIAEFYASLRDPKSCTNSLINLLVENTGTSLYSHPTQILKSDGNIALQVGDQDSSNRIQIQSMDLGDFLLDDPAFPNEGKAKLRVNIDRNGNFIGPKTLRREVTLQVKRKVVAGNNVIDTCFAIGGDRDLWTRNPNGSIYYKGGSKGYVGLGTTTPTSAFHIVRESSIGNDQAVLLEQYNNDNVQNPIFAGFRARGTRQTPLPVQQDDEILTFGSQGWDGAKWVNSAQVSFRVDGAVAPDSVPMRIDFSTLPPVPVVPPNANLPAYVRMTIKNNGFVGIGTPTPTTKLDVVGNIVASGCIIAGGATVSGVCVSDRRLKTDIVPFELGLDALMGFKPKTFKFNGLGGRSPSSERELGLIAQDVEKTAPGLVTKSKMKLRSDDKSETQIKKVNFSALVYVAINSIKELYQQWSSDSRKRDEELKSIEDELQKLNARNIELWDRLHKANPE